MTMNPQKRASVIVISLGVLAGLGVGIGPWLEARKLAGETRAQVQKMTAAEHRTAEGIKLEATYGSEAGHEALARGLGMHRKNEVPIAPPR